METTVVIIKPDAMYGGLRDAIEARYLSEGLTIKEKRLIRFTPDAAEKFYASHKGKSYFDGLVTSMIGTPVVAYLLAGENVIKRVRTLNGDYTANPKDYPEGTIRGDYRSAGGPMNRVHGSDSPEEVEREWRVVCLEYLQL